MRLNPSRAHVRHRLTAWVLLWRDAASVGLRTEQTPQRPVDAKWWTALGDPQLNTLIDEALAERVLAQRTPALRLMQDRVNAGLDTQLELRPFESSLPELLKAGSSQWGVGYQADLPTATAHQSTSFH